MHPEPSEISESSEISPIKPGLLVLHGNRFESLGDAVVAWLQRNPLRPLEEEIFLVQSNGVAEWLKMALAAQRGICAATRVELPGRFLWRAYRQVLGRAAVPARSALDKLPLTWRLMQCLPEVVARPGFEPLAGFLRGTDLERRHQLAQRLADLYDQYQVYRSDWLAAWAQGRDDLPTSSGDVWTGAAPLESGSSSVPLPDDQRWQALLWRELQLPLSADAQAATRPQLHRRFLAALSSGAAPMTPLPRRVVLFGMTHVPMQTLQALAALSAHCQVVLAVPNPCRFHWADIIQGRELLQMQRRRHPLREGRDLSAIGLEDLHAHAHPLLAAWGRQGRDFVRQLDAFDDALAAQQRFTGTKIDLFDEGGDGGEGSDATLLQQVQARIRDLVPLAEHSQEASAAPGVLDRSIVFHIAHSAQREVEVLHDQLLALLAANVAQSTAPLNPRDIVVMVPEIAAFAPAIRSVFGQYPRGDARFIPFDISDLTERGNNPLLVAIEWLLRLPQQRCRLSEIRDLLDVPGIALRFGVLPEQQPVLARWIAGAGIRWGLNAAQRGTLDLAACGDQNSWAFGLRRMLLGYANGSAGFQGIEPYDEVGGLEASIAGSLADVVQALTTWWAQACSACTPLQWAERARALIAAFVRPVDERERLTLAALDEALGDWLEACDTAGFDAPVTLTVAREAWLSGVDAPTLIRPFRAGGVTFCTLMPMRAVPFEVVCLLGMNDGDYPRRSPRSGFDLMALPGQQRPGDRSRRDDDRQLMLEALLSARRVLYVSWTGRSARDNSEQPPSVLVSQLRDYLDAGWPGELLAPRTTEHPLQPFSRRYFEHGVEPPGGQTKGDALFTHAREWRAAHVGGAQLGWTDLQSVALLPGYSGAALAAPLSPLDVRPTPALDTHVALTVASLARFLKNPVQEFFRLRLDVIFRAADDAADDAETFALDNLEVYTLLDAAIRATLLERPTLDGAGAAAMAMHKDLRALVSAHLARIRRAGRLPMAELGLRSERELVNTLLPMLARWRELSALYPHASAKTPLHFEHAGLVLDDWFAGVQATPVDPNAAINAHDLPAGTAPCWLELTPSRLCAGDLQKKPLLRLEKLLTAWVRMLAASACGVPVQGVIVGRDASVHIEPLTQAEAQVELECLIDAWHEGIQVLTTAPLPLACQTAIAHVANALDVAGVYEGGRPIQGSARRTVGEVREPCLARMYPDFEALCADGRFSVWSDRLFAPLRAWSATHVTIKLHDFQDLHELRDLNDFNDSAP